MLIVEHVFLRLNLQKAVLIAENVSKSCIEILRVTGGQLIKRARQARCFLACFFSASFCMSAVCFCILLLTVCLCVVSGFFGSSSMHSNLLSAVFM